jgi:hypothetical protein
MPEKKTIERARKDKRQGKSASTQAGEFVGEEMAHIREGVHGARSTKQAIAIGLSKARRAGVDLPLPKKGTTSEKTRAHAKHDAEAGQHNGRHHTNPKRSKAVLRALKREGHGAASHAAISTQAKSQAHRRTAEERSESAKQGARTRLSHQTHAERSRIAKKAARTRAARHR